MMNPTRKRDSMHLGMDKIVKFCKEPGKYLYQYRTLNTGFKMLNNKTIRFSLFKDFNDPTERTRFEELCLIGENQPQENFATLFHSMSLHKQVRAACFSQDRPEAKSLSSTNYFDISDHSNRGYLLQRMWAQYADSHKGICIAFDKEKLDEIFRRTFPTNNTLFSNPVSYSASSINDIFDHAGGNPTHLKTFDKKNLIQHFTAFPGWFFFSKQIDWSNECEYRWVYTGNQKCGNPIDINFEDSIEAIIVGHMFFPNTGDENQSDCWRENYRKITEFCTAFDVRAFKILCHEKCNGFITSQI